MGKFIVDQSFWNLFPQAKIGVITLKEFDNIQEQMPEFDRLLKESNEMAGAYLTASVFSENEVVRVYRDAYKKFKTKKGVRSSIENLLKRSQGEKAVGSINPLVDIYNAASLRYALPCGAEDLDTFEGDLQLTITEGGDEFYLIGEEENNPTLPGELCYKDEKGAVCRCFNWRDGARTMITPDTHNAFLVIELVDPNREQALMEALDFIIEKAEQVLNAKTAKYILDTNNREIVL